MQLEAVAPSHRPLAIGCKTIEHLVELAAHIVAHRYHRAVDEGDTRTFSEHSEFHKKHHFEEDSRHEFDETVVRNGIREF